MNRATRRLLLAFIDVAVALIAVAAAFVVRFAFDSRVIPWNFVVGYARVLPVTLPVRLLVFSAFGLYRQVWAHASIPDLLRIVWAVTLDVLLSFVTLLVTTASGFPRSVLVICWLLEIGGLGVVRLMLRLRWERYRSRVAPGVTPQATLIFGAGAAGAMLVKEFAKHPELGCTVVGFLDDDLLKQGYMVAGKPVLGTRNALEEVAAKFKVTQLLIAIPSAKGPQIREVVESGRKLGLRIKVLPGIYELVDGKVTVSQIRDVRIEDVLGRDEIQLDMEAVAAYLHDEVVLVTGAGGSIGSELCRQIARYNPKQLVLLGHGENSIYEIELELRGKWPQLELRPVIADIQDEGRIRQVFEQLRPGVVFHAAAHKHVPLMEANAQEAVKNNVFGTLNVATAAHDFHAERFVLISSDKAVNPSSVMGATKRAAELILQGLANRSKTIFVAVRFGNVLGSRGSVIPLFQRQIAAGGPVTVTDPRMIRYFMTIPEAVQLVIQAASMGSGGEIFVLDMGRPVRIVDLASELIRLSGLEPDVDIPIVFTGVRPGEKLFEELLTAEEGTVATQHQRIFTVPTRGVAGGTVEELLMSLRHLVATGQASSERIRSTVQRVVTEVQPPAANTGD